jgi:hypothetical protein
VTLEGLINISISCSICRLIALLHRRFIVLQFGE